MLQIVVTSSVPSPSRRPLLDLAEFWSRGVKSPLIALAKLLEQCSAPKFPNCFNELTAECKKEEHVNQLSTHIGKDQKLSRVMNVRAEIVDVCTRNCVFCGRGGGGETLTGGYPGVRVRNVRRKSRPKSLCLGCFSSPNYPWGQEQY